MPMGEWNQSAMRPAIIGTQPRAIEGRICLSTVIRGPVSKLRALIFRYFCYYLVVYALPYHRSPMVPVLAERSGKRVRKHPFLYA